MMPRVRRRKFLAGTAATALTANLPLPAIAQNLGIRIGLLTVKTGPLAQGGIQMEQGIALYLKLPDGCFRASYVRAEAEPLDLL
jgi:branched-chain amino acid transport system substrate-binding protein